VSLSVQAISVTPSPGNQMANHLGGGSLINKGAKNLVVTELYNLVACEVFRLRCIFLNIFFLQWQPRGYFRVAFRSFVYPMNWHIDFSPYQSLY